MLQFTAHNSTAMTVSSDDGTDVSSDVSSYVSSSVGRDVSSDVGSYISSDGGCEVNRVIDRPGVAGAVLQTALSLINSLSHPFLVQSINQLILEIWVS